MTGERISIEAYGLPIRLLGGSNGVLTDPPLPGSLVASFFEVEPGARVVQAGLHIRCTYGRAPGEIYLGGYVLPPVEEDDEIKLPLVSTDGNRYVVGATYKPLTSVVTLKADFVYEKGLSSRDTAIDKQPLNMIATDLNGISRTIMRSYGFIGDEVSTSGPAIPEIHKPYRFPDDTITKPDVGNYVEEQLRINFALVPDRSNARNPC